MTVAFKLGTFLPSGEEVEHRYPDCWDVQKTTGPDRLVIAPATGQVALLLELIRGLPEPLGLLYVLTVPRGGHLPGRYESPYPTDRAETSGFLKKYRDYLERDGRHHLWVTSLSGDGMLVYDNHNLIYAYGPLSEFEVSLETRGLARGPVKIPAPHTHKYNEPFDVAERDVMEYWPWERYPLESDDDP
jgi:hypothetical protein